MEDQNKKLRRGTLTEADALEFTGNLVHRMNDEGLRAAWDKVREGISLQAGDVSLIALYPLADGYGDALSDVLGELSKQDKRFGSDRIYSLTEWLAVLTEEVGEVAQEIVNYSLHPIDGIDHVKLMRNELVQVAAVAIQILKSYRVPAPATNEFRPERRDIRATDIISIREMLNSNEELYGGRAGYAEAQLEALVHEDAQTIVIKDDGRDLLTSYFFGSGDRAITFEPSPIKHVNTQYVQAIRQRNTRFLTSGEFPEYSFYVPNCIQATAVERANYFILLSNSIHKLEL